MGSLSRRVYGNIFGGEDPNSGLISGFYTMTMSLRMMR
jgi:hypothetical protein